MSKINDDDDDGGGRDDKQDDYNDDYDVVCRIRSSKMSVRKLCLLLVILAVLAAVATVSDGAVIPEQDRYMYPSDCFSCCRKTGHRGGWYHRIKRTCHCYY